MIQNTNKPKKAKVKLSTAVSCATATQGKGFGLQLLQYLVDYCKSQGIKNLWCNARVSAIDFYKKIGFTTVGKPYERNQISYIKMGLTF